MPLLRCGSRTGAKSPSANRTRARERPRSKKSRVKIISPREKRPREKRPHKEKPP